MYHVVVYYSAFHGVYGNIKLILNKNGIISENKQQQKKNNFL